MAQEYKLILKHADEPGYTPDIECYLRHGGYDALKKALGKDAGAKVIAGTLNQTGSIIMRAEKVGADTLLSQIVQLVAKAQRSRAPV